MAETLNNGTVIPQGSDVIDSSGVAAMRTLGSSVDSALGGKAPKAHTHTTGQVEGLATALAGKASTADLYAKGRLLTAQNIYSLAPGSYTISSSSYAELMQNLPEVAPGALEVIGSPGQPIKAITFHPYKATYWWRTVADSTSGAFIAWQKYTPLVPAYEQGDIPMGTDLNTLKTTAHYVARTGTIAQSLTNWPPQMNSGSGHLEVMGASSGLTVQRVTSYGAATLILQRTSDSVTAGTWTPWKQVWPSGGETPSGSVDSVLVEGAATSLDMRQRYFARRGGVLGTSGKPAVALRFDHHWDYFHPNLLPLLRERGLPWAEIMNPDNVGVDGRNDHVSPADMMVAVRDAGGEIWNHGGNHLDATTEATLRDQIVGSRDRLAAMFPGLSIEGWAPPGIGDGGYMGASPFRTVEQNSRTYAGQLITGHHAVVAGYAPGLYRTLRRDMAIGAPHYSLDTVLDHAPVVSALDDITAEGAGLVLMWHPNYIGQVSGYQSLETFTAILDELVARRDAGEIEVLAYSSMWMADLGQTHRHDLLGAGLSSSATRSLTGRWAPNRREQYLGGTRELVAYVDGAAGATVTLTATGSTLAASRTVTLTGGPQRVGLVFTVPLDHTGYVNLALTASESLAVDSLRCPVI